MNIHTPKIITRFFSGLHRRIQVLTSTVFLGALLYISSLFWFTGASPLVILELLVLPFMQGPPTIEREFEADVTPVVFSKKLNLNHSTAAKNLTDHQRIKRMVRSVVRVSVGSGGMFGGGSGVILDNRRCLVVTNAHVIDSQGRITVEMVEALLDNGEEVTRTVSAVVVGRPSAREDLALLQLAECTGMPWAYWLNISAPNRGAETIAIGHPNHQTWTSTVGTVSHPARFWEKYTTTGFGLIQTDAAINPGNSGGALFDAAGNLTGINSMILRRSNNLGYARSAAALHNYITHLRHHGEMVGRTLPIEFIAWRNLKGHFGIKITEVSDELNMVTGQLLVGDIILGANGKRLLTINSLRRALWKDLDGEVDLTVIREKELVTVTVKVTANASPPTS